MGLPKSDNVVPRMSIEALSDAPEWGMSRAVKYARRMIEAEARTGKDVPAAMARIESKYGIGFWTLSHLWKGNAKTCDIGLYAQLRAAYLDLCERQVANLQHEIAIERASGDDDIEDLEARARSLVAEIQARKAGIPAPIEAAPLDRRQSPDRRASDR